MALRRGDFRHIGSAVRLPGEGRTVEVMEVRLFGELEALDGGVPVPVRGAKQRALLALLALQRGQPVSADRLIDVLWGDGQAANPANALQAQIGQLRRTLGPAAILTTEAGYALTAGPDEVDVVRFERLVAKGQRLAADGELAPASAALGEALRLRRGEPLAEFTYAGFFDAERTRLDELTLVATESRAGADLGLGRYGELAGELEARCREHPLRERLWELPSSPCTGADGRPKPCALTQKSVMVWPVSWASTPGRPCGNSRPASWPRTRRSAPASPAPARLVAPPKATAGRKICSCRAPCSRRSCMSRGRGVVWCRVRG